MPMKTRCVAEHDIAKMQQMIADSGALTKTERMIEELADRSLDSLAQAELADDGRAALTDLALKVINRSH